MTPFLKDAFLGQCSYDFLGIRQRNGISELHAGDSSTWPLYGDGRVLVGNAYSDFPNGIGDYKAIANMDAAYSGMPPAIVGYEELSFDLQSHIRTICIFEDARTIANSGQANRSVFDRGRENGHGKLVANRGRVSNTVLQTGGLGWEYLNRGSAGTLTPRRHLTRIMQPMLADVV